MTAEEFLDFLEQYWELFGEPPAPPPKFEYKNIKI
jgi:hypothetical protein